MADRALRAETELKTSNVHLASLQEPRSLEGELHALEALQNEKPEYTVENKPLYVGGRPRTIDHTRLFLSQHGAVLLFHDGGIEHNINGLTGLVHQAGYVSFPWIASATTLQTKSGEPAR